MKTFLKLFILLSIFTSCKKDIRYNIVYRQNDLVIEYNNVRELSELNGNIYFVTETGSTVILQNGIIEMSATEEWLRYIESKAIMQKYNIKGYNDEDYEKDSHKEEIEVTNKNQNA